MEVFLHKESFFESSDNGATRSMILKQICLFFSCFVQNFDFHRFQERSPILHPYRAWHCFHVM